MRILSCSAPYGAGGMGHHLRQLVETDRAREPALRYFSTGPKSGDPCGTPVDLRPVERLLRLPPLRFHTAWRGAVYNMAFDRHVAAVLPPARSVLAFAGQALDTLKAAQRGRAALLELESATAHVDTVARQQRRAVRQLRVELGWLGASLHRRTLREYAAVDVCHVPSRYAYGSFVDAGFSPDRLRLRHLVVDTDRFRPADARPGDRFRVVYVGALTVTKGLGVLVDAFALFTAPDAELVLVGGWASAGMRRYLQRASRRDPRIRLVGSGDPAPHYARASVYVHPSYQDGFGVAPLEAAASGLPLVVTADTGMCDVLSDGDSAFIVPSGEAASIADRLWALYHRTALRERMGTAARAAAEQWCAAASVAVAPDNHPPERPSPSPPTSGGESVIRIPVDRGSQPCASATSAPH